MPFMFSSVRAYSQRYDVKPYKGILQTTITAAFQTTTTHKYVFGVQPGSESVLTMFHQDWDYSSW